ncbi:SNF1-interacting protein [Orbilia brochopaga]|uniref:SNF1-interacting protein n=1 Tax=Orbilia brochopaga TaxID=3140254 RepID=A0AAV9UME7_9PEZI
MTIPLSLIPVNLKESALDSPTFRANAIHFCEQVDAVEKWLEGYLRSTLKVCQEIGDLEDVIATNLSQSVPTLISESILDHDYSLLAIELFTEATKEFWSIAIAYSKRVQPQMIEPLTEFLRNDIKQFKECRRALEASQQRYDMLLQRYASQSKSKEASALREDAFQLHESRKTYIRSSFDFCSKAPELRASLDRVITRVTTDLWKEQVKYRRGFAFNLERYDAIMDRIKSWSDAMENSANIFKQELALARKDMEEQARSVSKPSRELEDYSTSTVPFLTTRGKESAASLTREVGTIEKQGWLFIRSATGKQGARSTWVRRWCFVKDGIFGCLVQGLKGNGVEETEKIGLLLCNVKPAFQEDRRFCFEIKTKDTGILLQAETQQDLSTWLNVFEAAKRAAVLSSSSTSTNMSAFAVSPPSIEFASSQTLGLDETEKQTVLGLPGLEPGTRASNDLGKRPLLPGDEAPSGVHGSRLGQILDLPSRKNVGPGTNQATGGDRKSLPGSGIQALISASHGALPLNTAPPNIPALISPSLQGPGSVKGISPSDGYVSSSLAPKTLVNLPMSTGLSRHAIAVSTVSDRGMTTPGGLIANSWGTSNWALSSSSDDRSGWSAEPGATKETTTSVAPGSSVGDPATVNQTHRKAVSLDLEAQASPIPRFSPSTTVDCYPNNYPDELRQQDGQFHILFPDVPREELVLLVFRATWKPNDVQEFPGRAFVTAAAMYFYSHHLGLVLVNKIRLQLIISVRVTPGKFSDQLHLHLKEVEELGPLSDEEIAVTTFLEPIWLLQRRLRYLVDLATLETPASLSDVIDNLTRMDNEPQQSPASESWEEVSLGEEVEESYSKISSPSRGPNSMRRLVEKVTGLEIGDGSSRNTVANPVNFVPPANTTRVFGETYPLSAKSLFCLIFGDKSKIFHNLYAKRRSAGVTCSPWVRSEDHLGRREFYYTNKHGIHIRGQDFQIIDILEDNRYYVVSDHKYPWMVPNPDALSLETTIVISQVSRSTASLSLWTMVGSSQRLRFWNDSIKRHASRILQDDTQDLVSIVANEINKAGNSPKLFRIAGQYGHVSFVDDIKGSNQQQISPYTAPASTMPEISHISLFIDHSVALAYGLARTAMKGLFLLLSQICRFVNLHKILLIGFSISVLLNLALSVGSVKELWHNAAALSYIESVGVVPTNTMRRSITLDEVEMATVLNTADFHPVTSQCFQKFLDIHTLTDDSQIGSSKKIPRVQPLSKKFELTRRKLGIYRHDLLVALSLLNRLETDILLSEWESWVWKEKSRCRQARDALQDAARLGGDGPDSLNVSVISYCRSCEATAAIFEERDGAQLVGRGGF